jgi:Arc/MetJ-type ribon-helix-helix transcriptional regulator
MQIAVVVPDEMVDDIDQLVPSRFRSRAEVVRHALERWLAEERAAAADAAYARGYGAADQRTDDVDSHRVRSGHQPRSWADLEW